MSGVRGFAVIHILFVILLSGLAPLGIASLLVAVEKTQTELEGLDIVDGRVLVRRVSGTLCFAPLIL